MGRLASIVADRSDGFPGHGAGPLDGLFVLYVEQDRADAACEGRLAELQHPGDAEQVARRPCFIAPVGWPGWTT